MRGITADRRAEGGYDRGVAAQGGAVAKLIASQSIARRQFLPFGPNPADIGKDVGGPFETVFAIGADERGGAVESCRRSKKAVSGAIARRDLLLVVGRGLLCRGGLPHARRSEAAKNDDRAGNDTTEATKLEG